MMADLTQLKNQSYVPYSGKPQGCIVKSMKGQYYPGVRIENASFPLTISPIQNALFCCLSEGEEPETLFLSEDNHPDLPFWKREYRLGIRPFEALETDACPLEPVLIPSETTDIGPMLTELFRKAKTGHSDFPVSALLETEEGFTSGVNIECGEWSYGLCAERVALAKAISYGFTSYKALHIGTKNGEFCGPCGACRQVIIEHLPRHTIHLHHPDRTESVHFSYDLLPYNFYSSSLRKED